MTEPIETAGLLLDLVNSRLVYDERVEDELDDEHGPTWLRAHGAPAEAADLADAREVRDALVAVLRGTRSPDALAPWLAEMASRPELDAEAGLVWRDRDGDGRRIGGAAIREWAALQSPSGSRIRPCAAPDCQHFFIDTSRANARRWHSMETCGNREKARRHYAKTVV
ncbi:CGNR zinc finger domain-containing protein [Agromyces lapidis]|uniref:CGNR zinc finger domain-containing protein n=1 Tax=Agromyces lapidis TaxID=279574 RepID=A0ABV5SKP0_9MICO|nr:CGNR zinc finger domain-containing protein [Agromyces lapidis]